MVHLPRDCIRFVVGSTSANRTLRLGAGRITTGHQTGASQPTKGREFYRLLCAHFGHSRASELQR